MKKKHNSENSESETTEYITDSENTNIKKANISIESDSEGPRVIKIDKMKNKKKNKSIDDKKILNMLNDLVDYSEEEDLSIKKNINRTSCKQHGLKKYNINGNDNEKSKIVDDIEEKTLKHKNDDPDDDGNDNDDADNDDDVDIKKDYVKDLDATQTAFIVIKTNHS